ncbi:MAG TPA: GGDEF domain-containing protein [Longimicrobiales bacterium]
MRRANWRALQGFALALGAPLGWLTIQALRGRSPAAELAASPGIYLYMLLGTMLVVGFFGLVLGEHEDRVLASNRRLEHLAITDPLTGLRNARYFHARLDEEQAERARTGEPLAVAVLDVDHFKDVNDRYGHLVGDDVLANVAREISAVTRQAETAARVGGEEFALLLPGSGTDEALEAVERVRAAIAAAATPVPGTEGRERTVRVTASAGVASTADLPGLTALELYGAADTALYRAKEEGRNRTIIAVADGRLISGA